MIFAALLRWRGSRTSLRYVRLLVKAVIEKQVPVDSRIQCIAELLDAYIFISTKEKKNFINFLIRELEDET